MSDPYEIINTEPGDLELIFGLFDASVAYQEKKGYPVWKDYDKDAIIRDIKNKNQYKIVVNQSTAMVFSICYTDKIIWREKDQGDSIYLHRIVVNPLFKGQRLFGLILDWAIRHARQKSIGNIRMDTWAANHNIIDYYQGFGFNFVENFTTPDSPALPIHNRNLPLALLEYRLGSGSALQ